MGLGVRGGHRTCSSDLHTVTPSEPAPSHGLTTAMKEPVMCSTSRSATRNCAGSVVRLRVRVRGGGERASGGFTPGATDSGVETGRWW